jgi:hypothetical protein
MLGVRVHIFQVVLAQPTRSNISSAASPLADRPQDAVPRMPKKAIVNLIGRDLSKDTGTGCIRDADDADDDDARINRGCRNSARM